MDLSKSPLLGDSGDVVNLSDIERQRLVKEFEVANQAISGYVRALHHEWDRQLAELMKSGLVSREEFLEMLRTRSLTPFDCCTYPCSGDNEPEDPETPYLAEEDCPLLDRAEEFGEQDCCYDTDTPPCMLFGRVLVRDIGREVERPVFPLEAYFPKVPKVQGGDEGVIPADQLVRRREQKERQAILSRHRELLLGAEVQRRAILQYLIQNGMTSVNELEELAARLLLTTEDDVVPCRDDCHRTFDGDVVFFGPEGEEDTMGADGDDDDDDVDDDEDDDEDEDLIVAPSRQRCPLDVRGRRGDHRVPCIEARRHLSGPPSTPENAAKLPDLVDELEVRPCLILGRIAATWFYEYALSIAGRPS